MLTDRQTEGETFANPKLLSELKKIIYPVMRWVVVGCQSGSWSQSGSWKPEW